MSAVGSRRIPARIPDLDQGQFIPFGDDDEYTVGVRDSDGNFVIQRDGVGSDLLIDENLNVTIPGDLTVNGATTTVQDVVTTDVFVEDANGDNQIHLSGDSATVFAQFLTGGEIRTGGGGAEGISIIDQANTRSMLDFNEGAGIVVNEPGASVDFRVESVNETGMLFIDATENQLVVHGTSDPNYGALFVQGRTSGGGADQDIVATLGEDAEDIQLNGNNTGTVQNVQIQAGNWTSSNAVSPNKAVNFRVEGVPTFGPNVTPQDVYAVLVQNRAGDTDWFRVTDTGRTEIPNDQLLTQDGSVGAPAFSFLDDLDLGLFRQAADTLAVAAGGVERHRFESDGGLSIEGSLTEGAAL